MFLKDKCIGCGACYDNCGKDCTNGQSLEINRNNCDGCGACTSACFANAKKVIGEWVSVEETLQKVEKDRVFYRNSNGGVTIGGGEPLAQIEFTTELLRACKQSHLHTAIETCGFSPWEKCREAFELVDQIHYDIKHIDSNTHKKLTGVSNELILENAERIAESGKTAIFRIPLIPGCNDDEINISETGKFLGAVTKGRPNISVEILPYHSMGVNKYAGLDRVYELEKTEKLEDHIKDQYDELLKSLGCNVV